MSKVHIVKKLGFSYEEVRRYLGKKHLEAVIGMEVFKTKRNM